jgi:hypothetical protein
MYVQMWGILLYTAVNKDMNQEVEMEYIYERKLGPML